ncbi:MULTISPECIES: peptidylprolyl isomerase [Deferrisoma]
MKKAVVWMMLAGLALGGPAFAANEAGKPQVKEGATLGPDTPIAVVNGQPVTKAEYDRAMAAYLRRFRQLTGGMHGGVSQPNEQMKSEVLQQLVDRTLLYQEAKKNPPADLEAQVAKELEAIKGRFPDEATYQKALEGENLTEDALKDLIAQQVLVRHYVETEIQPGVKVSDEEVKKFYEDNKDKFSTPEQVRASHILIRADASQPEAERNAAREKAEALQKRAAAGEDFATLAKENSEDPGSAPNGGDLGFFTRERMVKPFADAAFALETGKISDVVETRFGYHVIKVTDRKEATQHGFDEVKDNIAEYLKAKALDEAVQAKLAELRKSAKVDVVAPHL